MAGDGSSEAAGEQEAAWPGVVLVARTRSPPALAVSDSCWSVEELKRARIAELESQLSRHLRSVEHGEEIELTDRGEWGRSRRRVWSERIRLESRRTIDRARVRPGLPDREIALRRAAVLDHLRAFDLVLATHDREPATAATAVGFRLVGAPPLD